MDRDIFHLTKHPHLHEKWIDFIVKHIRKMHGNKVHAIVGANTRGIVSAINAALLLKLRYIPIRKNGKIPAEGGDLIRGSYSDREDKVIFVFIVIFNEY